MDVSRHILKDVNWEEKRKEFYKNPTINPYTERKIFVNGPIYRRICLAFNRKQANNEYYCKYFGISTPSPLKNYIEKHLYPVIRDLIDKQYKTHFGLYIVKKAYKFNLSYINQLKLENSLMRFDVYINECLKYYNNTTFHFMNFIINSDKLNTYNYKIEINEIKSIFTSFRIIAKHYYDIGIMFNLGQQYLDIARITRSIVEIDLFISLTSNNINIKTWNKYLSYYTLIDNIYNYIN